VMSRVTARVDTKSFTCETFGNDGGVDTKKFPCATFGNDTLGFIRVRKRPCWSRGATASWSFDIVKAVRVNGKPRHKFVLGLGSLRIVTDVEWGDGSSDLIRFWMYAIRRMVRHGIAEERRRRLAAEMVRKGARLPTAPQCREFIEVWPRDRAEVEGIMKLLNRNRGRDDRHGAALGVALRGARALVRSGGS
jgi:hypothetical protein